MNSLFETLFFSHVSRAQMIPGCVVSMASNNESFFRHDTLKFYNQDTHVIFIWEFLFFRWWTLEGRANDWWFAIWCCIERLIFEDFESVEYRCCWTGRIGWKVQWLIFFRWWTLAGRANDLWFAIWCCIERLICKDFERVEYSCWLNWPNWLKSSMADTKKHER